MHAKQKILEHILTPCLIYIYQYAYIENGEGIQLNQSTELFLLFYPTHLRENYEITSSARQFLMFNYPRNGDFDVIAGKNLIWTNHRMHV